MDFRSDLDAVVMGVLQNGGLHGYEITRRINEWGGDAIHIKEGQLYPILHRLENEGRVSAVWVPQEGKPARKVYRLTEEGSRVLESKRARWTEFVRSINALLAPASPTSEGGK